MLSLGSPKISLQHKTEGAEERIIEAIEKLLPDTDEEEKEETLSSGQNNAQAFQVRRRGGRGGGRG